MTREIEAIAVKELVASSIGTGSTPTVTEMEPTEWDIDDLAQTIEAPSAPGLLVMDAAEVLIADVGFDATSEEEIAKFAGVPIDVFRAHFADKRALLRALAERFCASALAAVDDAIRIDVSHDAPPHEIIEMGVRCIVDISFKRPALLRAIVSTGDARLLEKLRDVGASVTEKVARALDEAAGEGAPNRRDLAFALLLSASIAHHAIVIGPEWSGVAFGRAELYERALGATMAYLDARLTT